MMRTRSRARTTILAYLIVIVSLIFFVSPMLWIGYTSFRTEGAIFSGQVISSLSGYTLQNYNTIFTVTDFPLYFWNSLQIATIVTLVSLFVSIIGAYALSRFDIRWKNAIIMGIFSTQMFPQVLLIIPMFLVIVNLSLLDQILGVVFAQLILVLPFQIWMLKGYFDNLPLDLDEAARIDGCGIPKRLLYVILPVAVPGISVAGFYSFVVSWGDYLMVSVVNETDRTATVTLILQRLSASLLMRWGEVAAVTVLVIVPTILLFSFIQSRLVAGMTAGALREE